MISEFAEVPGPKFCKDCGTDLTGNKTPRRRLCIPCGKKYHVDARRKFDELHPGYHVDASKKHREEHKDDPEFLEAHNKRSKKQYEEHKDDPEFKEATIKHRIKFLKENPDYMREWRKSHPVARKIICRRASSKRRGYESNPINEWFEGSVEHHITPLISIFVPAELNGTYHSHKPKFFENLRKVNKNILEWPSEPGNPHSNVLQITVYTRICEEEYGSEYLMKEK